MKKLFPKFLSLFLVLSLTACGGNPGSSEPVTSDPPKENPVSVVPEAPSDTPAPVVLEGDSYWVAYESEGDVREYVPEGDGLLTDLTLWADGTARIREIEEGMSLVSGEDEQNMTWDCEEDGTLNLYTPYSADEPYWSGTVTEEGLELHRFGGTYRFREEPMPQGGMLYAPAELQGVWLQVGSEVEGDITDTMPGSFNSLVFSPQWGGDGRTLLASSESGYTSGFVAGDEYYDKETTLLDQPLYEGCGNDEWSVRIGEESPLSQQGYPTQVETYVTLVDQNTLLQQHYFSYENGRIPMVSYQTYKRFLPKQTYDLECADLENSDFQLTGYIDADGIRHKEHPEYSEFSLHLDGTFGGYQFVAADRDKKEYRGGGESWYIGYGGTLMLVSESTVENWYAGAAALYNEIPEIFLWDNMGGILCLERADDGGDEWDGYADTMTDLEGTAFAAPENAVLIYYGDEYLDMDWYRDNEGIPLYELADGPDVRQFLLSCVIDNTPVWIENDGFEIAQLGPMMAGESIIVQMGYDGAHLCFEYGGIEYYIELSNSSLPLDKWDYITV